MRAWEFITETDNRRPKISLRHIHHLKKEGRRVAASHARRRPIIRTMYANLAKEHGQIEIEKARLELEQQKAELAAARAEIQAETPKVVGDMAMAGIKADHQDQSKVTDMAQSQMRRRKK